MPEGLGFKPRESRAEAGADAAVVTLDALMEAGRLPRRRGLAERYLTRTRGPLARYEVGMWAWVANRVAALILVLYVLLHIGTLLYLPEFYETALFEGVAVLTVGSTVFHGLNGIRLILGDLGLVVGLKAHRICIVATTALALAGMAATLVHIWG